MSEEKFVEENVVEMPQPEKHTVEVEIKEETPDPEAKTGKGEAKSAAASGKSVSESLRETWKQVETFGEALSIALQGRGNVVMVRVNDIALEHLDMLVEAEVTKSRSESAAFLIGEGIKANDALFERIGSITKKISELREQLREEVHLDKEA
ncbi:MAG: hypothetical protein JXA33_12405 [Anaerolineae bacterium]|nr:hypothetical protein [Anaerolineae bacterium]